MNTAQPDPIPHLIAAVTELGFALRDLDASRPGLIHHTSVAQDGAEYADEVEALLTLILKRLRGEDAK